MPQYFNLTNTTSSTSVLSFMQNVSSEVLGGSIYLGLFILIIVFGVFFFAIKSRSRFTADAFAVACWMTTIAALMLRPAGLIDDSVWWIAIMLSPVAIFVLWIARSQEL